MKTVLFCCLLFLLAGCSKPEPSPPQGAHVIEQTVYTAINHPDRPESDRQRDRKRKPAEVLEFLGVQPGMKVLEMLAANGYYIEILSRVLGEQGELYSHNNRMYYEFQSDKFVKARLKDNRLPNVIRWDRELNDLQLPANYFDRVFMMLVFHDFYWSDDDPAVILAQVYEALKPGGVLAIVDHAALPGSGAQAAEKMHGLHRVEEALVKQTVLKAGFVPDGESDLLRNPDDPRDKPFFDPSLKDSATDRFVLRFKKPAPQ